MTRDVFPGGDHVLTPDGPIASDLGVDSASLDLPAADAALPVVPITTARQRIVPVLPPKKQSTFDKAQWGITKVASGEAHVRHDALGVDVLRPGGGTPSSVLLVPHLSDTHLVDEESPARTIELDGFVGKIAGGWRYQDAHMTYVLDAMIRKIREIDAFRPVDFVMHTGDAIDNCQYNELMWFQTVMAGGKVVPNSGALEDPIPGPDNDPHDGFTAMGLGTIPYYVAYGNHDGLVQGNLPLDSGPGDHSSIAGDPTRNNVTQLQLTKTDPPACHPIPTDESPAPPRCVPTYRQDLKAGSLVADKKRQDLNRFEYFDLWLKARGEPKGHGFDVMNATTQRGNYVVTPIPGVPLRLVGLDTCAPLGAQGDYPQKDIDDFLVPALKQAEVDG
ncbi:MAG: metallophosphoesterase, partial [Deltaproteobacteria bacterium]|nr:metallophosphoesterase [Deltaproteobacteria bacterium]